MSSAEAIGESWRVGGRLGFVYYRGELLDLTITPDAVSLSLPPKPMVRGLFGSTSPSVRIAREDVGRVSLGFFGTIRVETLSGQPGLAVMTIAQNRAILAAFDRAGYPTADQHPALTRVRIPILVLCLLVDFAILVGIVIAPGAWTFIGLPVMWFVTLLWAFPRLW